MTPNFDGLFSGLIFIGLFIWGVSSAIYACFDHSPKESKVKPVMKITTVTVNGVTKSDTTYVYPTK